MGPIGFPEMIVIFVVALLVFGPRKLPELGRTLGNAISEFRRTSAELRSTIENEMREVEQQTAQVAREAGDAVIEAGEPGTLDAGSGSDNSIGGETPLYEEKRPDGDPKPA